VELIGAGGCIDDNALPARGSVGRPFVPSRTSEVALKRILALMLACAVIVPAFGAVSAAAKPATPTASVAKFDKTKFVFDVGTASYAIHHFIYAPYKAGKLHGFKAYAKAAAAAAFAINRLHAAYKIANSGNSKLLHAIVSPLNALIAALTKVKSGITHGNTSAIPAANSNLGALSSAASRGGAPFSDVPTNV
jgi:hypothetical protein